MIGKIKSLKGNSVLFIVLLVSVLSGFILSALMYGRPFGTDTYTHIEETDDLYKSSSIDGFFSLSMHNALHPRYEGNSFNYPFGMWLYGSVSAKIMGVSPYNYAFLFPIAFLFIVIACFYSYLGQFIGSTKIKIFGLLFFLSMPDFILNLMTYRPSVFTIPFVLLIFYSLTNQRLTRGMSLFLISISAFVLAVSHVGTFMFILFFGLTFSLLYPLLKGSIHKRAYYLICSALFSYYAAMSLFPEVMPQYKDKARLFITTGNFFYTHLNLSIINEFTYIVYQRVFVEFNLLHILLVLGLFFSLIELLALIHVFFRPRLRGFSLHGKSLITIPFIGSTEDVSHSIIATPFWVGPLQSFLCLFGVFKLRKEDVIMFFSVICVTIIPGTLSTGQTGALREIYYLYLVMPVTAALGLFYLLDIMNRNRLTRKLSGLLVFGTLLYTLIVPIMAGLYYLPTISHEDYQVDGMKWLVPYGETQDRVEGYGYRDVGIFTGKRTVANQVTNGREMTNFLESLWKVYARADSSSVVEDLLSEYNLRYYVISKKIADNFGVTYEKLGIGMNPGLDSIYNSKDFSIYYYPRDEGLISNQGGGLRLDSRIKFDEEHPEIKDIGADFLIETETYRMRLNKKYPRITFFGDGIEDFLGDGFIADFLAISWYGSGDYNGKSGRYTLSELPGFSVSQENNSLIYRTLLEVSNEKWSTIVIKYSFYRDAVKREFLVSNDWVATSGGDSLQADLSSMYYIPSTNFSYMDFYDKRIDKTLYPSEDSIELEEKYKSIYFAKGDSALYVEYAKTAPYPESLYLRGIPNSEYSTVRTSLGKLLSSSESLHSTQYFSVGKWAIAKKNVAGYTSNEIYDYQYGRMPLVLISYLDRTNPVMEYQMPAYNRSITAYGLLKDWGVSEYTEGIGADGGVINYGLADALGSAGIDTMASAELFSRSFYSIEEQRSMIGGALNNSVSYERDINGFLPIYLRYNHDTVKVLLENGLDFAFIGPARAPVYEYFHEAYRRPQFAVINGEETDLVLLPISDSLGDDSTDSISSGWVPGWSSSLDAALADDGVSVFIWRSQDIGGNEENRGFFDRSFAYSSKRNLSYLSPQEIVRHLRLLEKVSLLVTNKPDSVRIMARNDNDLGIDGLTIKSTLPKYGGRCDYSAIGGEIKRKSEYVDRCDLYISFDIDPHGVKYVDIYPAVKNEISLALPDPIVSGAVAIRFFDSKGLPLENVIVSVEGEKYLSDGMGDTVVNLRKGSYNVSYEKPGYSAGVVEVNVDDRFAFLRKPEYLFLFVALFVLAAVFIYRRR